jgi:hypothetical protein
MSHHYSGPHLVFPRGDARLDFTDLYAFPKPGESRQVGPRHGRASVLRRESGRADSNLMRGFVPSCPYLGPLRCFTKLRRERTPGSSPLVACGPMTLVTGLFR